MAKKKTKKNNVSVKLIRGNSKGEEGTKPDKVAFEEAVKKGAVADKGIKPGMIISRIDYPEIVEYNDSKIRISSRSKLKIADYSKLGELPKGIFLKKLSAVK